MSKGDVIRGFVCERLAAATQEILEAVDRIVAGYEEEASGFRQQIERQRRQLEDLRQLEEAAGGRAGVKRRRNLGPVEEEEGEDEECPENLEDSTNQTPTSRSRARCKKRKSGRLQIRDTQSHVDLHVRILEDSETDVVSNSVLQKTPLLRLRCPRGLQEAEFVDLLKSTFPQLSGDKRFDVCTSDERRRLQPLNAKTPEDVHRNARRTGGRKSTLYIRLKTGKQHQEIPSPKEAEDQLACDETQTSSPALEVGASSSMSTPRLMEPEKADCDHRTSEPAESEAGGRLEKDEANDSDDDWKPDKSDEEPKQKPGRSGAKSGSALTCKVCGVTHESDAAFAKHAWSHVDDPGSVCGVCGELPAPSEALKDHLHRLHRTDESFPGTLGLDEHSGEKLENHQRLHKADKVFELREQLKARRRTKTKTHLCGVCGKSLSDYRSLSRHKMTHSGERPHVCQVCGRSFKLPGTLRQHEKIHTDRERSYLCDVCCKMFLTSKQLQIHMRTHTNEKPYHCGECGKGFITKGPLTIHMRVHTGEAPYRCPDCGWSFKRKINLDNHVTVHSGHKPFVCGICGKACARKAYLTVHMRTHNGERPYKCALCDKAFTQSHCLKTHMKRHLVAEAAT